MSMRKLLSGEQQVDIYKRYKGGEKAPFIAQDYNVSESAIYTIFNRLDAVLHRGKSVSGLFWTTKDAVRLLRNGTKKHTTTPVHADTSPKEDVYENLKQAEDTLHKAIENIIAFEVEKRVGEEKTKITNLMEEAKHSNWVDSLRKRFESGYKGGR